MNAPTGKVAAEIDWAKAWAEAFFTPCDTCPARRGQKCPGCAEQNRIEAAEARDQKLFGSAVAS